MKSPTLRWCAVSLVTVAQIAVANVIPRVTGSSTATADAPQVTRLEKRVCVDTLYTGDLIGYYYNPVCGGLDEFRCLANESKTVSGSFFNCARGGSVAPWPTQCISGTMLFAESSSQVWYVAYR
jgi:hypothetical protein